MPAALPPTPWLQPADEAGQFLHAYQTGASISEANARLQQQANDTAMQMQLHQQQLEVAKQQQDRQALLEQQKLEVAKAYHQAQIGLTQQRLQAAKQINDMKLQNFITSSQAKMRAQQRIAAGEDPMKVWPEEGPVAFGSMAGLGAIDKANQAKVPPTLQTETRNGETFYQSGQHPWTHVPKMREIAPGTLTQTARARLAYINKRLPKLDETVTTFANAKTPAAKKIFEDAKKERDDLLYEQQQIAPPMTSSGALATAPEGLAPGEKKKPTHRYVPGQGMVAIPQEEPDDTEEE